MRAWLCWLGWHRWETKGQKRACTCGATQTLTLVDFGRQKVWL